MSRGASTSNIISHYKHNKDDNDNILPPSFVSKEYHTWSNVFQAAPSFPRRGLHRWGIELRASSRNDQRHISIMQTEWQPTGEDRGEHPASNPLHLTHELPARLSTPSLIRLSLVLWWSGTGISSLFHWKQFAKDNWNVRAKQVWLLSGKVVGSRIRRLYGNF